MSIQEQNDAFTQALEIDLMKEIEKIETDVGESESREIRKV